MFTRSSEKVNQDTLYIETEDEDDKTPPNCIRFRALGKISSMNKELLGVIKMLVKAKGKLKVLKCVVQSNAGMRGADESSYGHVQITVSALNGLAEDHRAMFKKSSEEENEDTLYIETEDDRTPVNCLRFRAKRKISSMNRELLGVIKMLVTAKGKLKVLKCVEQSAAGTQTGMNRNIHTKTHTKPHTHMQTCVPPTNNTTKLLTQN